MIFLHGHTDETAQLVIAALNGEPGAAAAADAATDACANSATANYLAELQMRAETWLAQREEQS